MGFKLLFADAAMAWLVQHQHAGRDSSLVHVQATAAGVYYLHRSLLSRRAKDAERKIRHSFSLSPPGGGGTLLGSNKAYSQIHVRAQSTRLSSACLPGYSSRMLPLAGVFIPLCAGVGVGMGESPPLAPNLWLSFHAHSRKRVRAPILLYNLR